ncbi:hypothetical protein MG293_006269, partial [Ovis ammon polii]
MTQRRAASHTVAYLWKPVKPQWQTVWYAAIRAIVSFYPFLKALLDSIAQVESCLWLLSVFGQRWSIQT